MGITRSALALILVSFGVVSSASATLPAMPSPVNDPVPTHDATVGTMAGQAGVDGKASTYSVPIVVPPGRAGMQPSLLCLQRRRSKAKHIWIDQFRVRI